MTYLQQTTGRRLCRETIRCALQRAGLSWKKGKKLLGRACPEQRRKFIHQLHRLLDEAVAGRHLLVYIDEAHIHQDADLGYGWSPRGERLWVRSCSPGLSAKVSFFGLYLYNEPRVQLLAAERANSLTTIDALRQLRQQNPAGPITVVWDGAAYHRSAVVTAEAALLDITLVRLPAYSPDFMPVEALWRWLREEVTYNRCHPTAASLLANVTAFETIANADPLLLAQRLWGRTSLNPAEEKLRFSK